MAAALMSAVAEDPTMGKEMGAFAAEFIVSQAYRRQRGRASKSIARGIDAIMHELAQCLPPLP